jgi:Raf kinase inhibitor-like YbhB/YbcL family protein
MRLSSTAFEQNGSIPSKYTCDGDSVSPPLMIYDVPENTKTLVLLVDDPDVPKQLKPDGVFDHWVLFNIPPETREIPEGQSIGVVGANGAGKSAYAGPCPPLQYQPNEHRYIFTLYALVESLPLQEGASKADVAGALQGKVLAQTELVGRYKRSQ